MITGDVANQCSFQLCVHCKPIEGSLTPSGKQNMWCSTWCVCIYVHYFSIQNAKHPPSLLLWWVERCHGNASLARDLQWSTLTLVGDLWHLGHGQGQKVSNGRRATRALPWLALWRSRCPLHLQRSPPSQLHLSFAFVTGRLTTLFCSVPYQVTMLTAMQGSIFSFVLMVIIKCNL